MWKLEQQTTHIVLSEEVKLQVARSFPERGSSFSCLLLFQQISSQKKRQLMSEYWIIIDIEDRLKILDDNEREVIEDRFFAKITYKQLARKHNYSESTMHSKVEGLLRKMIS